MTADLQANICNLSREAPNDLQLNAITDEGHHRVHLIATDAVNARTLVDHKANVGIRNILHKNVLGTTTLAACRAVPDHLTTTDASDTTTSQKVSC